jgi:hypothetical protein
VEMIEAIFACWITGVMVLVMMSFLRSVIIGDVFESELTEEVTLIALWPITFSVFFAKMFGVILHNIVAYIRYRFSRG